MTWKALLAMGAALLLIVSWTATRSPAAWTRDGRSAEKIIIRQVGHQLLLQAGDSTSRILPVEEPSDNEYLIRFSAPFTFIPDSLVATVGRVITANGLPASYLVEVIPCATPGEVIFGFRIDKDNARNVVPCLGREQLKACYMIRLKFAGGPPVDPFSGGLLVGSFAAILISLLIRFKFGRKKEAVAQPAALEPLLPQQETVSGHYLPQTAAQSPTTETTHTGTCPAIPIGNLLFYKDSQQLVGDKAIVPLTAKEAKLLLVFATAQQEVIDRNQLLKIVWEDEGVIVGRSLDMFVSRLRKKLQGDPRISILNVHGKGYKLVVGPTGAVTENA